MANGSQHGQGFWPICLSAALLSWPAGAARGGGPAGTADESRSGPGAVQTGPAADQGEPASAEDDEGPQEGPQDQPGASSAPDESGRGESGDAGESPERPGFEVAARASVSSRGEAALDLLARVPLRSLRLLAGTGGARAVQGPARGSALLGVEVPGESTSGELLLRFLPSQAGAALVAGRAEVRQDHAPWAGGLSVEAARFTLAPGTAPALAGLSLTSALVTLEVQYQLPAGFALQARGSAGLCRLSTPAAAREFLWQVPGTHAGQWPQRAAAGVGLRLEEAAWGGQVLVTYELPAASGTSAVEFGASAERRWTRLGVGVELAAARQQPTGLWISRATLEVRWR